MLYGYYEWHHKQCAVSAVNRLVPTFFSLLIDIYDFFNKFVFFITCPRRSGDVVRVRSR